MAAALTNPDRPCFRLFVTSNALADPPAGVDRAGLEVRPADSREIDRRLPPDAVHQGLALECGPLPPRALVEVTGEPGARRLLLALDQVSDARNVGAILRSAAALGVAGVIVPRHGSAELGGTCAKAASGALDRVPVVEVVNLARTLDEAKDAGFRVVGLDAEAPDLLERETPGDRVFLVFGAEGKGLRRLTAERCDVTARLAIDPSSESLNVSVAVGIALYLLRAKLEGGTA